MSPRTYIGPFGRILPLSGGSEPERFPRPPDEGRGELHLPQPQLNFGSDTSLGVTDPTRYNTTGPARTTPESEKPSAEQYRANGKPLPPVRHLFTSSDQASIPSSSLSSLREPSSLQQDTYVTYGRHDASLTAQEWKYPRQLPAVRERLPSSYLTLHPSAPNSGAYHQFPEYYHRPIYPHAHVSTLSPNGGAYGLVPSPTAYQQKPIMSEPSGIPTSSRPQHVDHQAQVRPHANLDDQSKANEPGHLHPPSAVSSSATATQLSSSNEVKPTPRVIREEFRPDQGLVYVYEDGSVCPKVVAGETVIAEWGVTKAGKPRKRLAIACTSCREKKTKCDPAVPKCAQCEKFGRVCKYATATRNQRIQSETPSYESQAHFEFMKVKTEPNIEHSPLADCNPPSVKPSRPVKTEPSSPCPPQAGTGLRFAKLSPSIEKRKLPSPAKSRTDGSNTIHLRSPEVKSSSACCAEIKLSPTKADTRVDGMNPLLPSHYIDLFLQRIGSSRELELPRDTVMEQSISVSPKDNRSRMLIYAMLALGTTFSKSFNHEADGKTFGRLARQTMLDYSLHDSAQVMQTRLLLALYYSITSQSSEAWVLAASGLPAALEPMLATGDLQAVKGIG